MAGRHQATYQGVPENIAKGRSLVVMKRVTITSYEKGDNWKLEKGR